MIDTHFHIYFEEYDEDRDEVINRAKQVLDYIIDSGTNPISNKYVVELSKKYSNFLYPTYGYYPVSSEKRTNDEINSAYDYLINHLDDYVAIGEVGMDYFFVRDKSLREKQKKVFTGFVEIANEYEKPLLIHGRNCDKKVLNIVNDYENIPYVIFHCFSGSLKTAKRIMEHDNYFMSFSTMVCYSKHHQDLIKDIPVENIVVETDSPFLALTKEERNEPAFVLRGAKKISEIKNISYDYVDEVTTYNAKKVFGLK